MVHLTECLRKVSENVKRVRKYFQPKFIDSLRLHVQGGAGGMGLPKYGGIGGPGGNVYVEVKEGATMKDVAKEFKVKRVTAGHGENSSNRCILGRPGEDKIITGPPGITVYNHLGQRLGDLNEEGFQVLVARGGAGGCPQNGFCGARGEAQMIRLDLRLIADVGFVGFPNAGKSTLLSRLSKAKPKIASYPFTTIQPNIGVMEFTDMRQITLADLPGLIEGAHSNIGMGHSFLRHVERTKLLLMIADINGFKLSAKHGFRNCLETIVLLNKELELYKEELLDKPAILILNKMDTNGAQKLYDDIKDAVNNLSDVIPNFNKSAQPIKPLQFHKVLTMSAKNGSDEEINHVKESIRYVLDMVAIDEQALVAKEAELLKKLENSLQERGPLLV